MSKPIFFILSLSILFSNCQNSEKPTEMGKKINIDLQGHRGARGILPENTIPAFIEAMKYDVTTLELDVVISKDSQIIVSHEPWMNHAICTQPNGEAITKATQKEHNLFQLTYEEIKQYDCGSLGNSRFPDQKPMAVHKPSLRDLADAVATHLLDNDLPHVNYNIEIKSSPEGDNVFHPDPAVFARLLYDELQSIGMLEYCNVQSFDPRPLEEIHKIDSSVVIALLIDSEDHDPHVFEDCLKLISFKPDIYSCHYPLVTRELVEAAHAKEISVIPWTVNTKKDMKALIEMGVDGIITDYPNYAAELIKN